MAELARSEQLRILTVNLRLLADLIDEINRKGRTPPTFRFAFISEDGNTVGVPVMDATRLFPADEAPLICPEGNDG